MACDYLMRFAFEKGAEKAFKSGAFGFAFGDDRAVKVAAAFLGMLDHVLVLQSGKEGADGGVGRRVRQFVLHILRGGLSETVEDIEDLSLTA